MTSDLTCLVAALALLRGLERIGGAKVLSSSTLAEAARSLVHLGAAAIFLGLTARPLLALLLLGLSAVSLVAANMSKIRLLDEPITFSDLFLLPQIVRHPRLYYLHRAVPAFLAVLVLLSGLVTVDVWVEPSIGRGSALAVLVFCVASLFVLAPACASRHAATLQDPATGWGTLHFGVATAVVLQFAGWLTQVRQSGARRTPPAPQNTDLVVIQLESFVDLLSRGYPAPTLAGWKRLQQRAVAWGRLVVDAKGANTTRTEFSVITGLSNASLGFDRFQPYLRARDYRSASYFEAMRTEGWDTTFVHPFDADFFNRAAALTQLGASSLVMEDAFAASPRVGRYVSDTAVLDRVADLLDASSGASFVFAVTMENHGPWADAAGNRADPVASYLSHVSNGVTALEALVRRLAQRDRDTLVLVYGDHVPALRNLDGFIGDATTDYLLICPKRMQHLQEDRLDRRPEDLIQLAISRIAADSDATLVSGSSR